MSSKCSGVLGASEGVRLRVLAQLDRALLAWHVDDADEAKAVARSLGLRVLLLHLSVEGLHLLDEGVRHHLPRNVGRCGGDAGEMRGRCGGDAGEMQGRCGGDAGEMWPVSRAKGSVSTAIASTAIATIGVTSPSLGAQSWRWG